jgi:hypothetical protein
MSRLILHIGTHKTATTSLQRHLARNRAALAARGIWYPDYELIGKGTHYAHLGIVNGFSGQHEKFSVEDARAFFREVGRRARDHEATIISGEPFYRHVAYERPGPVPRDPEVYWPQRAAYVAQIREAFGDVDAEIAVVFRRQVDYAPSLYQEQVKVTRYARDFATFRQDYWFHFDYLGQARVWARVFPRLRPMRFEDLVAGGDPSGPFGALLGLDLSGPVTVPQQNVSMPPDAVILKRMLHATKIDKDVLREDIEAMLNGPLRRRLKRFRNRSFYTDAADMKAFHRRFERDNAYLGREFFGLDPDAAPLFSDRLNTELRFGDTLHPIFLTMLLQAAKASNDPSLPQQGQQDA